MKLVVLSLNCGGPKKGLHVIIGGGGGFRTSYLRGGPFRLQKVGKKLVWQRMTDGEGIDFKFD